MQDLDFRPRTKNDRDTAKPQFFIEPVHLVFKSEQEGRPIYEDREFVRIITPGIAKSMPVEEVTAEHKNRWPQEYATFKSGLEEPVSGTPLEKWPQMTPSMCLMLKAMHVRTVEELAVLDDNILQGIGIGGRQFRDKAKEFVERANTDAPVEAALARAALAEERFETLQRQFEELKALLPQDSAEEKRRGPGRPPKVRDEED